MSTSLAAVPLSANLILGAFMIVSIAGLVLGWFTIRGSGIHNHPWDGAGAPGAKLPDEFHRFADWQIHEADLRDAEIERRVEERLAREARGVQRPQRLHTPLHLPPLRRREPDMSVDDVNQALAAEASLRKEAEPVREERTDAR